MVGQFGRPAQIEVEGWQESLLWFKEVKDFFRDFGHAMHHMVSKASYARLSGVNVEWDFVELPTLTTENLLY